MRNMAEESAHSGTDLAEIKSARQITSFNPQLKGPEQLIDKQ